MINMKKFTGIVLILVLASIIAAGCGSQQAKKETYPTQSINGIIAWGAGGGTDSVSRLLAPVAEKELGKPIILSNKTGATGSIATQYVFDQKADGYTLLFNAENPQLYQVLGISKLSYDDFEPIIIAVRGSTVIVVPKDSPYNTIDDLINAAKKNPGKINMGISGVGGQPYVTSLILKKMEGITFNKVTFDGDGPLIAALMGKQIDVTGLAIGAATQYIKNGDLKALAVMTNEPVKAIPDVPAMGVIKPQYKQLLKTAGFFYGVFVKKGTPEEAVTKLRDAFHVAFKDPKFQEYCQKNGLIPMGITGEEAKNYMKEWQSQMAWLIYDAGDAKESPEVFGIPRPAQ
ncbi:Bug family tripartite tricarboxylate transporter substrate binding protein [Thermoanaerobacterium sp. DL9XJH110]|uniref:Bug family tripartite tricarboxylate transporter substrate binding protein n=1 Tax=Thermoanaerobacterium sp. DL9XJH110 TaxID=3386643 RepID=UPI003BB72E95